MKSLDRAPKTASNEVQYAIERVRQFGLMVLDIFKTFFSPFCPIFPFFTQTSNGDFPRRLLGRLLQFWMFQKALDLDFLTIMFIFSGGSTKVPQNVGSDSENIDFSVFSLKLKCTRSENLTLL